MKGDFTRRTFHSRNHYRSVLLQQGRVQLDADWNEQIDIWAHLDRLTTVDCVGPHGGPMHDAGMAVTDTGGDPPAGTAGADLRISPGRYYVGGILCENEEPVPLADQPDLPDVPLPTAAGRYVAYLDVWSEHVTAVERPSLREVALGGPDTATRGRTIWQVRLETAPATATCVDVAPPWTPPGSASTGRLRARAQSPATTPNPCVIPATAGYRRLENQLYRVEIFDDSDATGGPTYVWSRDNGSVAARLVNIDGDTLTIDAPGRDERLGFAKNQWVEVTDTGRVRRGEPGFLGRLGDVAGDVAGTELPVVQWRGAAPSGLGDVAIVRRWDSDGAVAIAAGWVPLEDGVEIEFEPGGVFHTGDHWLIPARTANLQGEQVDPDLAGDVEWPRAGNTPLFQTRAGVEHRFAAVALLDLAADGTWTGVSDCRRLFPPLTELTDVEYAGGDGQEAMPGDPLPQPLAISVSNGIAPVAGAPVRFTAADADGRLAPTAADLGGSAVAEIEVTADADGIARCFWRPAPDPARHSQRVTARLLDPAGGEIGAPILFSASLSVASQVAYDPGACVALAGADTVQEALDRLVSAWSLAPVGGDGQDGRPGTDLPLPAEVLVRSDCGPVAGAVVRFTVRSGAVADAPGGLGAGQTTVDVTTGADGLARCFWRLGPAEPVQALAAELRAGGAPVEQPARLAFTANLRSEGEDRPGLHVRDVIVLVGNRPLLNDSIVLAESLVEGIAVRLDGVPLKEMVNGKPILRLTVDMPYPFFGFDQEMWGSDVIGTTPLTLAGPVTARDDLIIWSPTVAIREFLLRRLWALMAEFKRGDQVLCHLTLNGWAVADSREPDRRVVNGLTLGRPRADGGTDMELPSIDDVRGADFTLWFWLVPFIINLVVVPTREGLLRLKTARDALSLALPRAELQARLPAGVQVTPGDPDRDAARRLADRAFRDRPARRLVFVVDERYAEAATVVREALAGLDVELELIAAADPAEAARRRLDAGEPLDGVLTGDDVAGSITDRAGFIDHIPL